MVTIVLILNMLIAGLCWYGVWRIWQWRLALARVTAALTLAEQDADRLLSGAVAAVRQGQTGTAQVRQQYRQILVRCQQVQQMIALLGLGRLAWQQYERRTQNLAGKGSVKGLSHHPYQRTIDRIKPLRSRMSWR